jgi:hypothetical protein
LSAADDAGEQEIRAVAAAAGSVLAALGEDGLGVVEGVLVDQRLVCGFEVLIAPANASEVGRVGEDAMYGRVAPAGAQRQCVLGAELVGDCDCAEPVLCVEPVDTPDNGRGDRVGRELAIVEGVPERRSAAVPAAFLGAAFYPGGDPVNDGGVLELGEHAEHLQHHAASWRASVEWLGRRAQDHAEGVQLLGDPGELAHLARQAVDSVDEQLIDLAQSCQVECGLQAGALQLCAGGAVFVVSDDLPVLLHLAECLQPFVLRGEGGRLVLLVGGDAGVEADARHLRASCSSLWLSWSCGSSIRPDPAASFKFPRRWARPSH